MTASTNNEKYFHFEEGDYWCQAVHFVGHADDKDNSYMLIRLPKQKMNKEEAAEFFLQMMVANRQPGAVTTAKLKTIVPLTRN